MTGPAPPVRVYLPVTPAQLAELWQDGQLAVQSSMAYAVTPALREQLTEDDTEQLEYAALLQAARASLALLADETSAPRRLVVALDVPPSAVAPARGGGASAVQLAGPRPLSEVACALADGTEDHELAWYATQEIPALLASRWP